MIEYNFGDYVILLLAGLAILSLPAFYLYFLFTYDYSFIYDFFIELNAGMPK